MKLGTKQQVIFKDLGQISYKKAWDYQQTLMQEIVDQKLVNRNLAEIDKVPSKHQFLLCEHPPVYTLGKSGSLDHLLLSEAQLKAKGIEFYKINRGGDITFHGLQQIVGYPILDLDYFFTDIHKYVRYLEEAVIRTLKEYNITGERIEGYSGVWLPATLSLPKRKICAVGVHLSRWVTMHGFAFNVNTDLTYFDYIIPCGIKDNDKGVTSMQAELGMLIDIQEVKHKLKAHFCSLFDFELV